MKSQNVSFSLVGAVGLSSTWQGLDRLPPSDQPPIKIACRWPGRPGGLVSAGGGKASHHLGTYYLARATNGPRAGLARAARSNSSSMTQVECRGGNACDHGQLVRCDKVVFSLRPMGDAFGDASPDHGADSSNAWVLLMDHFSFAWKGRARLARHVVQQCAYGAAADIGASCVPRYRQGAGMTLASVSSYSEFAM